MEDVVTALQVLDEHTRVQHTTMVPQLASLKLKTYKEPAQPITDRCKVEVAETSFLAVRARVLFKGNEIDRRQRSAYTPQNYHGT